MKDRFHRTKKEKYRLYQNLEMFKSCNAGALILIKSPVTEIINIFQLLTVKSKKCSLFK